MPIGNPKTQTIASKKYQQKVGLIAKSYKIKKEIADRFKEACDMNGESQAVVISRLMEQYINQEDKNMTYALILSTRGSEEIVATGTKEEMQKREASLRKECRKADPDGSEMDCYIISEAEAERRNDRIELTEEERKDIIEVDGKKYIRKIYEEKNK